MPTLERAMAGESEDRGCMLPREGRRQDYGQWQGLKVSGSLYFSHGA